MENRKDGDTSLGGTDRNFPSTQWSRLDGGRGDSDRREGALRHLATAYWKPIYAYVRARWSRSNEDSKDIVQEFFISLVESGMLTRFDPYRGPFRRFVKGALERFMADRARHALALKRGGANRFVPLDAIGPDLEMSAGETPDQALDRIWRSAALARAEGILKAALEAEGKDAYYKVFRDYFMAETDEPDYGAVAARHGLSTSDVSNYLQQAKRRFREILREVVAETVSNPADLQAEMATLFGEGP